jgi:magnesium-transporting ATPase (P-type)
LGQKTKITKDTSGINIIFDLPFNAEKKMRATIVSKKEQQSNTLYVIGAADNIIMDSTTT